METYALFEDGSASRIVFEFFTPSPTDDPVRLACTGIQDPGVVHSAQNGCLSAYHLLSRRGYIKPGERFFPSSQFGEAQANLRARGSSAGLAFCLKFSREVNKLYTEEAQTFAVAATGVIENGSREALVGRVEGMDHKVRAALGVLRCGDLLFVPAANAEEISTELRVALADKGVQLKPVATVAEALALLIPPSQDPDTSPPLKKRFWLWLGVIAFLVVASGWVWMQREVTDTALKVEYEQGKYRDAKIGLESRLDQSPADREAAYLHHQLTDPLGLEISFFRQPASSNGLRPEKVPIQPGQSLVSLAPGDLFRFSYTLSDSCYLYVMQLDKYGEQRLLTAEPALLKAGQRYYLPADTQDWFRLEEGEAGGSICLLASRRPGLDLEQLWRKYRTSRGKEREDNRRELLEHLDYRREASADGLAGVFFAELQLAPDSSPRIK